MGYSSVCDPLRGMPTSHPDRAIVSRPATAGARVGPPHRGSVETAAPAGSATGGADVEIMTWTPMFPLGVVLFPGEAIALRVFEERYLAMLEHCASMPSPSFGVVLIERGSEVGGGDVRSMVATLAHIDNTSPGIGGVMLECRGAERLKILEWLPDDPFPRARVEVWPDEDADLDRAVPARRRLGDSLDTLIALAGEDRRRVSGRRSAPRLPDERIDPAGYPFALARALGLPAADRYRILAAPDQVTRRAVLADAIDDAAAVIEFRGRGR